MEFEFDMAANAEKIKDFRAFMDTQKGKQGALMPVLHKAQSTFGYLPIEIQKMISEELNVPLAEIYGVATFYAQFSLVPTGEYTIGVCLGTACYVRGAQDLVDKISQDLDIEVGATSTDRRFTLIATRCIGACGLAPVLTVNEDVYGKLKVEDIDDILAKYKAQ